MANIQEDVNRQIWDLLLKFLGTGSEFVYQIAHEGNVVLKQGGDFCQEVLVALINKQKENREPTDILAQMLSRVQKGESINTMTVAEEDAAELQKHLKEKGILYHVLDNLQDDTKFFWYMSDDAQKFVDVVHVFQAEQGLLSELNPQLFLENFAKDGVGTISGLDKTELEVFRNFAKEKRLVFTSTPSDEPNQYIIAYDPKDANKAKNTMVSVLWALSGSKGSLLREQINAYLKNKQAVHKTFLEPEKEYYILNGENPDHFAHLTANDFTYFKNSKEIMSANRKDADFIERGMRVFDGLSRPVIFTREEYESFMTEEGFDKEGLKLKLAEKVNGLPNLDSLKKAQREQNDRLERLQSKIALDEENAAGFWIYNDSIDSDAGGIYEENEDIDEETKKDIAEVRDNINNHSFAVYENRGIDYLISVAEKRRKDSVKESINKESIEKETDIAVD